MDLKTYLETSGISQEAFGKLVGVTQAAVCQWVNGKIPAERLRAIIAASRGALTLADLRPDIFGVHPKKPSRDRRAA